MRGREFPAGAFLSRVGKEAKGYQGGRVSTGPSLNDKRRGRCGGPSFENRPGLFCGEKVYPTACGVTLWGFGRFAVNG